MVFLRPQIFPNAKGILCLSGQIISARNPACVTGRIISNIFIMGDVCVRVHSLHVRVTLGPNMPAHAHASKGEHGILLLWNLYSSSVFVRL